LLEGVAAALWLAALRSAWCERGELAALECRGLREPHSPSTISEAPLLAGGATPMEALSIAVPVAIVAGWATICVGKVESACASRKALRWRRASSRCCLFSDWCIPSSSAGSSPRYWIRASSSVTPSKSFFCSASRMPSCVTSAETCSRCLSSSLSSSSAFALHRRASCSAAACAASAPCTAASAARCCRRCSWARRMASSLAASMVASASVRSVASVSSFFMSSSSSSRRSAIRVS